MKNDDYELKVSITFEVKGRANRSDVHLLANVIYRCEHP